jgi:hypothetical protein
MNRHAVAARLAAALVALVAAGAACFEHIASVALGAGERAWVAYALPLAIDGLIVVGVAALLEDKRAGRDGRLSARLAVLAVNVASAEPTWTARLVAVANPVSFLLSVEVLTRTGRTRLRLAPDATQAGERVTVKRQPAQRSANSHGRNGARRGQAAGKVAAAMATSPDAPVAELARLAGVSRSTVRRHHHGRTPELELTGS